MILDLALPVFQPYYNVDYLGPTKKDWDYLLEVGNADILMCYQIPLPLTRAGNLLTAPNGIISFLESSATRWRHDSVALLVEGR